MNRRLVTATPDIIDRDTLDDCFYDIPDLFSSAMDEKEMTVALLIHEYWLGVG